MKNWKDRATSPEQALRLLNCGNNLFLQGAAATPTPLIEALCKRGDLEGVTIYHLHLDGPIPFADPAHRDRFLSVSLFTGPSLRRPIEDGRADFMPIFLSDIPSLFNNGPIKLDAVLLQLSPPDRQGYCSLGTSVDASRAAADNAKIIIAEINQQMPRTHGDTLIKFDDIDAFIASDRPLIENMPRPESVIESKIADFIAELVEDGSTLQMGVGAIPDAVLQRLNNKRDLGVHTEMFSDRLIDLVECGAVTNKQKSIYPGVIVTSFVMGTKRLFNFIDDNPLVYFQSCDRTNDTALIRKNPRVTAINSALQVDLTGQVCADSIGHRIYSGIGGQMDFIRGAALSEGGKPIIALPATAKNGQISRITMELAPGAGVVTTRGHVHWVVTEFGAVNLHGKSLRQRAEALISIAHPDFRSELQDQFHNVRHFRFV